MSTQSQIRANRENAQHSTGPKTEEGKASSSQNNFRHGFTGAFSVLPFEDQAAYGHLFEGLLSEHRPQTITETILIEKMAQAHWLSQRAQRMQELTMGNENLSSKEKDRRFALFLRYQTTNDRAFSRALHDLLKLRAEKRKALLDEAARSQRAEDVKRIGFESQERKRKEESRKQAQEARREASEKRKQELHKHAVDLAEMKVLHHEALAEAVETDRVIAQALHQREMESNRAA